MYHLASSCAARFHHALESATDPHAIPASVICGRTLRARVRGQAGRGRGLAGEGQSLWTADHPKPQAKVGRNAEGSAPRPTRSQDRRVTDCAPETDGL